jgi:hypothetical protein
MVNYRRIGLVALITLSVAAGPSGAAFGSAIAHGHQRGAGLHATHAVRPASRHAPARKDDPWCC